MVALQSHCFMQVMSHTAINDNQRRLAVEAVPDIEPLKKCQNFCEQAVCVSELLNCQCQIPELQMSSKLVSVSF